MLDPVSDWFTKLGDAVIYGFKRLLPANDSSVHVISTHSEQLGSELLCKFLVFAVNSLAPPSLDQWNNLTINYFRSLPLSYVWPYHDMDALSRASLSVYCCALLMMCDFSV